MQCPYTFEMLEGFRAAGLLKPMDEMDYMAFAGAADGSLIWYVNDEWYVVYGHPDGAPEGEMNYEVGWTHLVDGDEEPQPNRCWQVDASESTEI